MSSVAKETPSEGAGPEGTDLAGKDRLLGLIAAIAAISVAGAGFGHSLPLFAVLLERYGASSTEIGLNSGAGAAAVILTTPFYPRIIAKVGLKRFLIASVLAMVLPYLAVYAVGDRIIWWYPLRFAFSVGASGMFVGSEIWINGAAPTEKRGKIIGIYSTCLALGFALGPLLVKQTGYDGFLPFFAGILVFSSAAIPVLLAKAPPVDPTKEEAAILPVVKKAPVTFGASATFGAVESTLLVFLPVFAIEVGYGEGVAAELVTAYGIGLVALQYGVGQAADRFGVMRILIACAVGAALSAGMLPAADGALLLLYPCVFLLGGLVAGISTSGLVLLGDRFTGRSLAAASTGYSFAWGLGAVAGPPLAGALRDAAGQDAMVWAMVALLSAYALFAISRRKEAFP